VLRKYSLIESLNSWHYMAGMKERSMMKIWELSLATAISGQLFVAFAAPASIGIVQSAGGFRLANAAVFGNGTIFEGDQIETAAWSAVDLPGQGRVRLGPDSRANIYRERTVLHSGTGVMQLAERYAIEAGKFRISPASKDSVIQVDLTTAGKVAVSARSGFALVRDQAGVLLASVRPGLGLSFSAQGGAATGVTITGTVSKVGDNYLLTDDATKTVYEVRGENLESYNKKRVKVAGALIPGAVAVAGATQVVSITTASIIGAAVVAGGISTAATVAIVAASAGAIGGVTYAVASDSSPE
jgi:hypothetical protein